MGYLASSLKSSSVDGIYMKRKLFSIRFKILRHLQYAFPTVSFLSSAIRVKDAGRSCVLLLCFIRCF